MFCIQISVSEIDFREWYHCVEDLKKDEDEDLYPPRFITQFNCHQRYTLDVTYAFKVIKDGTMCKDYKFNVFVKGR